MQLNVPLLQLKVDAPTLGDAVCLCIYLQEEGLCVSLFIHLILSGASYYTEGKER